MKHISLSLLLLSFAALLKAQDPQLPREANFSVTPTGRAQQFKPLLPPLQQIAGAPKAYWTYEWEFGDGGRSTQESPTHTYDRAGEFTASLDATAHYDNGKKATRKKTKVVSNNRDALAATDMEYVFDPQAKQAIAMASAAKPRAGEELTFVLSYRNNGRVPTDGELHLFFNEKSFPTRHFQFVEARPCFGEVEAPIYSAAPPASDLPWYDWTTVGMMAPAHLQPLAMAGEWPPNSIVEELLRDARGKYRAEQAWKFADLEADEKRNFFVSLAGTPTMVKDVNTFIHVQAVFAPADPAVPAERFVLEMQVVASHDPNVIAVSDNRINYRSIGDKKINYKIEFQNNGEGPASAVMVKVEIPEGLDMKKMRPLEWQPKCPICPRTPTKSSCLDTLTTDDGYLFTFHNIYLPGSHQDDVEHRDSTKGFVRYRIEADRNMPKYSFRSRAKIIFDRNPPIYTNYTRTRFKVGVSPGIKVGWAFSPDSLKSGYFFLGGSLSPYKSWRAYPQIELLAGLKGQQQLNDRTRSRLVITPNNNIPGTVPIDQKDSTFYDTLIQSQRGFVSFEVPVLLRKNFSDRLGLGFGVSARVFIENGTIHQEASSTTYDWQYVDMDPPGDAFRTIKKGETDVQVDQYNITRYRFSAFADLTFGSVRAGPNVGIRAGAILGKRQDFKPFVQFSVELKM